MYACALREATTMEGGVAIAELVCVFAAQVYLQCFTVLNVLFFGLRVLSTAAGGPPRALPLVSLARQHDILSYTRERAPETARTRLSPTPERLACNRHLSWPKPRHSRASLPLSAISRPSGSKSCPTRPAGHPHSSAANARRVKARWTVATRTLLSLRRAC